MAYKEALIWFHDLFAKAPYKIKVAEKKIEKFTKLRE